MSHKHEILPGLNKYGQPMWMSECPVCKHRQKGEGWYPDQDNTLCGNCGVHYTPLLKDFNSEYRDHVATARKPKRPPQ
jgi:hypothetical protein